MVTIASLWLPVLVSAVAVFFASSLVHMVLPWHKSDYAKVPDEDAFMESLRRMNAVNGNYHAPFAYSASNMKDPAFKEKLRQGPLVQMYVRPGGDMNMGPMMTQWFAYALAVAVIAAYLCSRTLAQGADYLAVFRLAGLATFLAYAGGQPIESIWFMRSWSTCFKNIVDGLIYALLTGGIFGWLWPR
jgi:hypothetical protein